jgi:hypothetical protein
VAENLSFFIAENFDTQSNDNHWDKSKEKHKFHCDHCQRDGHMNDRCWILHPNLKLKSSKQKMGVQQLQIR